MKVLRKVSNFHHSWQSGFTLIELMITMAIVAILAAIAQASYRDHVINARRAEAKVALEELVVLLERRFTERGAYNTNVNNVVAVNPNTLLPAGSLNVPADSPNAQRKYRINLAATANTFTLTAIAQNDQVQDQCGNLSVDQANTRTCTATTFSPARCRTDCWQK